MLDMRKTSNFCDYFVICSGNSQRQVTAIADAVKEGLDKINIDSRVIEGTGESGWVLLDYFDVVVHIFYSPLREFYQLERLWQEAPRLRPRMGMKKNARKAGRRKLK